MRIEYLSYALKKRIPVYGSMEEVLEILPVKAISSGDSCNVFRVGMENHWGTHVDCPAHFFQNGKRVEQYEASFWFFNNPQIINLSAQPGQIIAMKDLSVSVENNTDFLILNSGWAKYRGQEIYCLQNPGLDPEIGLWLRKERPNVRAVGFDFISVSSFRNREVGRLAHKAFLDPDGVGDPIVLVEDMFLSYYPKKLEQVWVVPLRFDEIDSSPCTILGVFE
ncbi:MAG: cyclase [Syntrophomonadaceae bacterium]|mgnify:CR=1 FL=1|nr:cyclase [Syntrophomonadaceae bacterium]